MNRRSTTIETLFANSFIRTGCNRLFVCAIVLLHHSAIIAGTIAVDNQASLHTAFQTAIDGDEIVLAPGIYRGRFTATGMTGVTIRSADPTNRAVINAAGVGEGIRLSSAKRVTLKDLIIEQAGVNAINIDDGGFVSPSRQITIQNLLLRDGTGHGIKLAGVDRFRIERVEVIGWGSGNVAVNLIGAHRGIVERSFFMNGSPGTGVGVQAKGGSADVVIRANRFVNANERAIQIGGATVLESFRPQPPGDVEASRIVAEGNTILNNGRSALPAIRAAVSFINTRDGVYRNNVAIRPSGFVARILKENSGAGFVNTQGGKFMDNIIIWETGDIWDAVNVGPNTDTASFHFAGNRWHNRADPRQSRVKLPNGEVGGTYGVDPNMTENSLADWPFEWGHWVVNTTNRDLPHVIDPADGLMQAMPAEGAELDLGQSSPLIGDWRYAPTNQPSITIPAFSYILLMRTTH